tara:strand:- start:1564 stop:1686 length:123 start_codon:yes stop_codon:yes gene_type:complete
MAVKKQFKNKHYGGLDLESEWDIEERQQGADKKSVTKTKQ